ncbi:PREDICTED: radial spoke head protein 9 homolog [Pygoscelis adeliae]|nr:PREDICTED: radial spoke head protein 9 homolog [Pygoscelis adeliae]
MKEDELTSYYITKSIFKRFIKLCEHTEATVHSAVTYMYFKMFNSDAANSSVNFSTLPETSGREPEFDFSPKGMPALTGWSWEELKLFGTQRARACVVLVAGSLNCVEWSLLPPATEEMVAQAEQLKGRFQGDPSFEYEYTEINAEDAERLFEDGKEPMIKEESRLVATIEQIDRAVGIIPRGAFLKTPLGSVRENRNFEGLSLTEAKKLSSYFHFTEPVNLKNKTLLEKADLDPSTDFLDSLEHDIPQGSWTVQLEKGGTVVVLRSLLWLGLTFYHVPMTKQYGYVYFGTGEKNLDLPFML